MILSLENIEVNDKTDYSERVSTYPLGNTINMGILRGGKVESVSLKVSLLPASRVADYVKIWLGFTVNKIQQSLVRRYRLVTSQGVVVTSVTPNSVSDKIGVQSGDIIRQVNQVKIENEKDFRAAMVEVAGRDSVLILVQRGQNGYYVTLEP